MIGEIKVDTELKNTPIVISDIPKEATEDEMNSIVEKLRNRIPEFKPDAYDACLFIMGGAGFMSQEMKEKLSNILRFTLVQASQDVRFIVGDGGTDSGVMSISGLARNESGNKFALIGVCPQEDITGFAPPTLSRDQVVDIEPHHSVVLTVKSSEANEEVPTYGYWGRETNSMYKIFHALAEGKKSIGLLVNGGSITADEVIQNIRADRPLIILSGTGRLADGLYAWIQADYQLERVEVTSLTPDAYAQLTKFIQKLHNQDIQVDEHKQQFILLDLEKQQDPEALLQILLPLLGAPGAKSKFSNIDRQ